MTTYTIQFYTEADWAETRLEADTPEQALEAAHRLVEDELWRLDFQSYDGTNGIEQIEIRSATGETVLEWQSEDLRVRLAARDLLGAAEDLLEQIAGLHGESSVIDEDLEEGAPLAALRAAIAKAKGGAA